MILDRDIVLATQVKFRRGRWEPDALAKRIGEGRRDRFVSTNQRRARFGTILGETGDPATARQALERLVGGNDLVGVSYLARGTRCARSVCRIHLRGSDGSSRGFGTGFLVAPGVVMTNQHVIAGPEDARYALAEFDYEIDLEGNEKPIAAFAVVPDGVVVSQPLDFCLAAVAPRSTDGRRGLDEFGWLPLDGTPGKAVIGEYLTIIQHPGGERKQVCVRENKLLRYEPDAPTLWYATDTVAGSSGSPVFNESWQVVALHHSGVPRVDKQKRWLTVEGKPWDSSMDESRVDWIANEGIRISGILASLAERNGTDPVAAAVLRSGAPKQGAEEAREKLSTGSELRDGALEVTVPVRISVRVGDAPARPGTSPTPALAASPAPVPRSPGIALPVASSAVESVTVDQTTYARRPGYQADFLGAGNLRVPLPVLAPALHAKVLLRGQQPLELKYWNYSVVMHRTRRLAVYAAVNVDAGQRPSDTTREGDQWYFDTRIPARAQIGPEFYKAQSQFEVDRSLNPFDRGHLVRRLDAQWGSTARLAKRNGDDSFHWTNCSPQHWKFNQGAKRWLGLEDYVIATFAGGRRACVINGPVFDAPPSTTGSDGRPVPDARGKQRKDPVFGGVGIPKMFFKVVACVEADGGLAAAAFLLSQEDLIATDERIRPEEGLTDAEAKLFQVPLSDVARLTGLDFGPLGGAETRVVEMADTLGPRQVERFEDIRLR